VEIFHIFLRLHEFNRYLHSDLVVRMLATFARVQSHSYSASLWGQPYDGSS